MYNLQDMKNRIKKIKSEKGITNQELATLSDIPIGTLNKMLGSETKDPQISTIIKISQALEVSADYLILGKKSEDKGNLNENYTKLNDLGKQKADEYIADLAENPKYTQDNKIMQDMLMNDLVSAFSKNKVQN